MEVLCKLLVLCALVFSANIFTTAESTNSNGVRNELILKNLLFDGITGGLKIPELNELKNLNECAAIYNIKIIERVIIASSKLRQCANVKEFELLTFLQQQSSSAVKTAFQQKMTACSKHECFADLIMDLFNAVHPMLRRVWQIKRCVIHEIKNAALEVEKSNDACRIAFLRLEYVNSKLELDNSSPTNLELDNSKLELLEYVNSKLELDGDPIMELDNSSPTNLELDNSKLELLEYVNSKLELDGDPIMELDNSSPTNLELDNSKLELLELDDPQLEYVNSKLELDDPQLEYVNSKLESEHPELESDYS
ncbi:GH21442 [Drosophila grimshawi]|uniref:GH21442 n=1 Tax=Drosophila grimshawi TaxID=7222 RepID=B4J9F8_DROGR|nr:GH21442 [Drosophila grimshawi]